MHRVVTGQQHGTFYGNCERERCHLGLEATTTSAWPVLLEAESGRNPLYDPVDGVLSPDFGAGLALWVQLYLPR